MPTDLFIYSGVEFIIKGITEGVGASRTPRPTPSGLQSAEEWSTVPEFAGSFSRAFHNSSAASSLGPGWLPEERGPWELEMEVNSGTEMDSGACLLLFSCSVMLDSATPWTAACQASLSITNSWSLLKLMSIELVMPSNHLLESEIPSNHLILCHPLLLLPSIFSSFRVFSNESALPIRWPKYWCFSFIISPSNDYSGLISFRIDWFDLQGLSKIFSCTTVRKHQFFSTQPSLWSNFHTHI